MKQNVQMSKLKKMSHLNEVNEFESKLVLFPKYQWDLVLRDLLRQVFQGNGRREALPSAVEQKNLISKCTLYSKSEHLHFHPEI